MRAFSSKPKDTVTKMDPAAGTVVDAGSEVTITVSDGVEQVEVNDVVGKQADSAETILKGDGFKVTQKGKSSDTVPEGQVISQNPAAGSQADKGSTVTITVSRGLAQVTVPNVINLPEGEARRQIEGEGFEVSVDNAPSATIAAGTVISQDPGRESQGGQGLDGHDRRLVRRRRRSACRPSPASRRTTRARPSRTSGSPSTTADVLVTDPAQDGVVQETDPPAGSEVPQGSTVTILVGRLGP